MRLKTLSIELNKLLNLLDRKTLIKTGNQLTLGN